LTLTAYSSASRVAQEDMDAVVRHGGVRVVVVMAAVTA